MASKESIGDSKSTIAHELGHILDNNLGRISKLHNGYYNVAKEEGQFVTNYAKKGHDVFKTAYAEDFAESMSMYIKNKLRFAKKFPKRYEYINNLFNTEKSLI